MADQTPPQNTPEAAKTKKDEYGGQYKGAQEGLSEAHLFGTDALPKDDGEFPVKNAEKRGG